MRLDKYRVGFTLLEMVLVLGIIAVAGLIIAPRWAAAIPGWNLTAETQRFVTDIKRAQQMAKANQINYGIRMDQGANAYYYGYDDGSGFINMDSHYFQGGVTINNVGSWSPANDIFFDHLGSPQVSSEAQVTLQDKNGKLTRVTIRTATGALFYESN